LRSSSLPHPAGNSARGEEFAKTGGGLFLSLLAHNGEKKKRRKYEKGKAQEIIKDKKYSSKRKENTSNEM